MTERFNPASIEREPPRPTQEKIQAKIPGYLRMRDHAKESGTLDRFEASTMRDLRNWVDEGWDSLDRENVFPGWSREDIRQILDALEKP